MTISERLTIFADKPVVDWEPSDPLQNPADQAYRISLDWGESEEKKRWTDKFASFLEISESRQVTALIIGTWEDIGIENNSERVVEALVAARDRLPALKAIFLADVTFEESEISWIRQCDVSPILAAYPELEEFGVRGGNELSFGSISHSTLKTLKVESGGLPREVVQQIGQANLPELKHLEIWLGDDGYGGNTTLEDLTPILEGNLFPKLEYLGICDSQIADEIAAALNGASVLEQIKTLDLSLGTLGDAGAEELLANPAVAKLQKLDLHHNYCSDEMIARLKQLPLEVDVSEQKEADNYDDESHRYVAVSE